MYLRNDPANPRNMSADERLEEVASILARGILRLRGRLAPHLLPPQILPQSSPTCLDLPAWAHRPTKRRQA
jgi:hypothetical protein